MSIHWWYRTHEDVKKRMLCFPSSRDTTRGRGFRLKASEVAEWNKLLVLGKLDISVTYDCRLRFFPCAIRHGIIALDVYSNSIPVYPIDKSAKDQLKKNGREDNPRSDFPSVMHQLRLNVRHLRQVKTSHPPHRPASARIHDAPLSYHNYDDIRECNDYVFAKYCPEKAFG